MLMFVVVILVVVVHDFNDVTAVTCQELQQLLPTN